jgi:predicted ATPase with chaperone activity
VLANWGGGGDSTRECRCTPAVIPRYPAKISGPLLDRIDLHIEVPAVPYKELRGPEEGASSSEKIRARVERALAIADLATCQAVAAKHLAEAVQYRSLDRQYWS